MTEYEHCPISSIRNRGFLSSCVAPCLQGALSSVCHGATIIRCRRMMYHIGAVHHHTCCWLPTILSSPRGLQDVGADRRACTSTVQSDLPAVPVIPGGVLAGCSSGKYRSDTRVIQTTSQYWTASDFSSHTSRLMSVSAREQMLENVFFTSSRCGIILHRVILALIAGQRSLAAL